MKNRRSFLATVGTGTIAGLAGCQGLTSLGFGSSSSSGPLIDAFLGEPWLGDLAPNEYGEPTSGYTEVALVDVATLSEHAEYLTDHLSTTGTLSQSTTDEAESAVESVDRTAYSRSSQSNAEDEFIEVWTGYVDGDVDAAAYDQVDGTDPARTSYGGYDLYEYADEPAVAIDGSGVVVGHLRFYTQGELENAGEYPEDPAMARHRIDALASRPAPPDWIEAAVEAARPFDIGYVETAFSEESREEHVRVEAHEVHGEETTFRVVRGTRTAEQFEEFWERFRVEETLESEIGDVEATFDVGDTIGTAVATVPTVDTDIGAEQ